MKTLFVKIVLSYLFLFVEFTSAQHEHNNRSDNSLKMLFSTQQSEFSAEVQSSSKNIVAKEQLVICLKLSSRYLIDSSSVALKINSSNRKIKKINYLMEYSAGFYNTAVIFQEPGSYQFTFSFNLIDSSGILNKTNFSFSKDVKGTDNMAKEDHGFMGMSNAMMLMMGVGMLAMMVIAIVVGTGHK